MNKLLTSVAMAYGLSTGGAPAEEVCGADSYEFTGIEIGQPNEELLGMQGELGVFLEGDIPVAQMTLSVCGTNQRESVAHDRADLYFFLKDAEALELPQSVRAAFSAAYEAMQEYACDENERNWINASTDGEFVGDYAAEVCPGFVS